MFIFKKFSFAIPYYHFISIFFFFFNRKNEVRCLPALFFFSLTPQYQRVSIGLI